MGSASKSKDETASRQPGRPKAVTFKLTRHHRAIVAIAGKMPCEREECLESWLRKSVGDHQDREQGMVELMGSQIGSQIEIRLGETAT